MYANSAMLQLKQVEIIPHADWRRPVSRDNEWTRKEGKRTNRSISRRWETKEKKKQEKNKTRGKEKKKEKND